VSGYNANVVIVGSIVVADFILPHVLSAIALSRYSPEGKEDVKAMQSRKKIINRHIIGKTTKCVDAGCNGWLVDSFLGKYWIRCLDTKHNIGEEGCSGPQPVATHPTYNYDSTQKSEAKSLVTNGDNYLLLNNDPDDRQTSHRTYNDTYDDSDITL
jgi:hypothetical protein